MKASYESIGRAILVKHVCHLDLFMVQGLHHMLLGHLASPR